MTGRIFAVALLAGLAAGLAVSVLQHFTTTPIILHAEEFEAKPIRRATMPKAERATSPKPGRPRTGWSVRSTRP